MRLAFEPPGVGQMFPGVKSQEEEKIAFIYQSLIFENQTWTSWFKS